LLGGRSSSHLPPSSKLPSLSPGRSSCFNHHITPILVHSVRMHVVLSPPPLCFAAPSSFLHHYSMPSIPLLCVFTSTSTPPSPSSFEPPLSHIMLPPPPTSPCTHFYILSSLVGTPCSITSLSLSLSLWKNLSSTTPDPIYYGRDATQQSTHTYSTPQERIASPSLICHKECLSFKPLALNIFFFNYHNPRLVSVMPLHPLQAPASAESPQAPSFYSTSSHLLLLHPSSYSSYYQTRFAHCLKEHYCLLQATRRLRPTTTTHLCAVRCRFSSHV